MCTTDKNRVIIAMDTIIRCRVATGEKYARTREGSIWNVLGKKKEVY